MKQIPLTHVWQLIGYASSAGNIAEVTAKKDDTIEISAGWFLELARLAEEAEKEMKGTDGNMTMIAMDINVGTKLTPCGWAIECPEQAIDSNTGFCDCTKCPARQENMQMSYDEAKAWWEKEMEKWQD